MEGVSTAEKKISDSLGAGTDLIAVATVGGLPIQGIPLEFNLDNGKSLAWIYAFRTESGDIATVAVVRLIIFTAFSLPEVPLPLPEAILQDVNKEGTYSDSDKMLEQLEKDQTYSNYRKKLPESNPSLVILGQILDDDSDRIPDDFPLAQSIWTVSFTGQGDSAMTCWVATGTGQTFCFQNPFSSVDEENRQRGTTVTVGPNPARDIITVTLHNLSTATSRVHLGLFNSLGEEVLDLSSRVSLSGSSFSFETGALPAGLYHLILTEDGRVERTPLVVVE